MSALWKYSTLPALLFLFFVVGARTASADEWIFGFSTGKDFHTQQLNVTLGDGSSLSFTTDQSEFTPGFKNQGWWSTGPAVHFNDSPNYFTGWQQFSTIVEYRDYFTFDLSTLPKNVQVTGATLDLSTFQVGSTTGRTYQPFSLWNVSTDTSILNLKIGVDPIIFSDLGSGTSYGTFLVPVNNAAPNDPFPTVQSFSLNSAALGDIEQHAGGFFSIGGSGPSAVPEPGSIGLATSSAVVVVGFWMRRRNRSARNP